MSQSAPHPARSAEFLSRLHDGDLTAAERAQFEAHRAHCAECRESVYEFEAALALYRSNRPRPAAGDLSARILRKLQQSNRRPRPLGFSLGIDLRWAGAFAAAVAAAIIGFSVVARQEAARTLASRQAAIPVTIEKARAPSVAAAPEPPASRAPASPQSEFRARRDAAIVKDSERDKMRSEPSVAAQERLSAGAGQVSATPPALLKESNAKNEVGAADARENAPARIVAQAPPSSSFSQQFAQGDRQGGEGSVMAFDADGVAVSSLRLVVTAADGGAPPELLGEERYDLPSAERGREYSLVVDGQGRVTQVEQIALQRQKTARSEDDQTKKLDEAKDSKAPRALWQLRFRPSDQVRLLRVRIE